MRATTTELEQDLVIVGLSVRTAPERAATDIPAAWERFGKEKIAERVTTRTEDARLYAVYCDYESDASGRYTMVLGVATKGDAAVPAGLRRVRLPRGRYARFVATGDPSEVIWRTWVHVNTEWADRGKRRYIADCERYSPEAFSPTSAEAEVLVGVE